MEVVNLKKKLKITFFAGSRPWGGPGGRAVIAGTAEGGAGADGALLLVLAVTTCRYWGHSVLKLRTQCADLLITLCDAGDVIVY